MIKQDEIDLMNKMRSIYCNEWRYSTNPNKSISRRALHECGMSDKRAACILDKWTGKGWYDYGVSLRAGWLTTKGLSVDCDGLFINASVLPCNET